MRGNPACSHCSGLDAEIRYIERMIAKTKSEFLLKNLRGNLEIAKAKRAEIDRRKAEGWK